MDWSDITVNPVSVVAVTTKTNLSGDNLRVEGAGTVYMASVQQGGATLAASLEAQGGIQAGQAVFTVFFASEPMDAAMPTGTTRTNNRLESRDLILWTTSSGQVRRLEVLDPVRDEGGAGEAFSVDCAEVA